MHLNSLLFHMSHELLNKIVVQYKTIIEQGRHEELDGKQENQNAQLACNLVVDIPITNEFIICWDM